MIQINHKEYKTHILVQNKQSHTACTIQWNRLWNRNQIAKMEDSVRTEWQHTQIIDNDV